MQACVEAYTGCRPFHTSDLSWSLENGMWTPMTAVVKRWTKLLLYDQKSHVIYMRSLYILYILFAHFAKNGPTPPTLFNKRSLPDTGYNQYYMTGIVSKRHGPEKTGPGMGSHWIERILNILKA